MKQVQKQSGFTLVELLVAIAISTLLISMIGVIFAEISEATRRGLALSKVITDGRTVVGQIRLDAEYILGPDATLGPNIPAGFIVILNQLNTDTVRRSIAGVPETITRPVRSDQLSFIFDNRTKSPKIRAIGPSNKGAFTNNTAASFLRVWYGHVHKTGEDGTDSFIDSAADESGISAGQLMGVDFASERLLGRQALHLAATGPPIHGNLASGSGPVVGYNPTGSNGYPSTLATAAGSLQVYLGLTDVIFQELRTAGGTPGVIDDLLASTATYGQEAYYRHTYSRKRLRANPMPLFDPAASTNFEYEMASWQIAQMHPILAENVSDFIVDFAGDYIGDLGTGGPDGNVDVDTNGNIIWYGYWYNDPIANLRRDPTDLSGGSTTTHNANEPDIYFPPLTSVTGIAGQFNDTANAFTPEYIDSTTTPALGATDTIDSAFVFRHDDAQPYTSPANFGSRWPHMLRIRYRIHDKRGLLAEAGQTPGRSFQIIIKVPRP